MRKIGCIRGGFSKANKNGRGARKRGKFKFPQLQRTAKRKAMKGGSLQGIVNSIALWLDPNAIITRRG